MASQIDNVTPLFTSYSVTDVWQPNDKLLVNFGARFDHFAYATDDLEDGYPARQFWFNAYNREHCGTLGQPTQWTFNPTTGTFGGCNAGLRADVERHRTDGRRLDERPCRASRLQRLPAARFVYVHARSEHRHSRIVR